MPRIVVLGGGIAGLAAAHALARAGEGAASVPLEVVVVEAAPRLGGKIATERAEGFLIEAGADSFSTRRPDALELVEELGLAGELLPTGGGRVLVLRDGRLEELPGALHLVVPTDLGEILRSRLLSAPAKARMALELLRWPRWGSGRRDARSGGGAAAAAGGALRSAGEAPDQAAGPFLRRHFGAEYLERVAGPLLAGIHATDPELLSLAAAFPGLAATARRHGSLIRAARGRGGSGGPTRVSLAGGVGSLIDALVQRLEAAGVEIATGRAVVGLQAAVAEPAAGGAIDSSEPAVGALGPDGTRRGAAGFLLTLAGGASLAADAVVLAAPPAVTGSLLEPLAPGAAAALGAIPTASTATVSLGFRRQDVRHPLDALGLLVPAREGRALGACTFASSKFPGRAPAGAVLVRAYLGAGPDAELPSAPEALAELALAELGDLLGLAGPPLLTRVHRFGAANPQYRVGHRERIAAVEAALPPNLALAGCAYHGLGIPDCIASGRRAAERILSETS
ncbi:MAG TPA: FAD-dependent oxidoreductase [Thermoanaerobaculia bacterium]|nr:FAD-dependent oxidoreductase [Thermoanaerobaculia bacterium]